MKNFYPITFLFLSFVLGAQAANFVFTPNVISNNYTGVLTFQMNGLAAGETVQVEEFFDVNGNGLVETNDRGVRFETVQDGQVKTIAGVPNPYAFSDIDGTANGAITAVINFAAAADTSRGLGHYIFRVSSPSNHFNTTNLLLTVVSPPYAQSVQGAVKNNSTNVPFAVVALTQMTSSGNIVVAVGDTADASGNFSIPAPPGKYQLVAFQRGYVNYLTNFPVITLAANATLATNLNLMPANSTLSGSLVDSTNYAVPAVRDCELLAFSTNVLITLSVADSNGNFSIPVTSNNVWTVRPFIQSALPVGYLTVEQGNEARFQTFFGPASNSLVLLKRATAVLYGKVLDNHSNSVPGISLLANTDGGQYDGAAVSDANGNYFMAIDGGGGFIEVQNLGDPPANNYLWTGTFAGVNNGQAANVNVTGTVATARFRSHFTDDTGAPLTNVFAFANSGTGTSTGTTDANGLLDLPVFAGTWRLYIQSYGYPQLVFPTVPPFQITDGVNYTNNVVARTVTGAISGYVRNASNVGISNITVTVTNSVGSTNYVVTATTDTNGNYSVSVFNGTWNVSLDSFALERAGYNPASPVNVPVPPASAIANFTPGAIPPPQILTTNLPDSVLGYFYDAELDATNGTPALVWSLASGTLPGGLSVENFGIGIISGTITNFGLFHFTVKVTDANGRFATQALSINVLPTPPAPLAIATAALPDGAAGCAYSNVLQATGGSSPYSWSLASGSDPLPDGLSLGTDGSFSGIPSTNAFANLLVQVSDSVGGYASTNLFLAINTALQVYPGPLNGGTLGSNYFGQLFASGGQQPQLWSIVSGTLPPNLTLDPTTGIITGTPTATGNYVFTARVDDGCAGTNLDTSIAIYTAPFLATTNLPIATPNTPYNFQLQAAGGLPPYFFYTSDPLPGTMLLNGSGLLSGETFEESTNTFLVQVYDSNGSLGAAEVTLISSTRPVLDLPAINGTNQFSFRVTGVSGQSYTAQFSADLTNWTELYTTNAPDATFIITDTNATGGRYYRIKVN